MEDFPSAYRWWQGQRRYSSVDYRHRRRWRTWKITSNSSARWVTRTEWCWLMTVSVNHDGRRPRNFTVTNIRHRNRILPGAVCRVSELARRRNHRACYRVRFSRHGPGRQPSWWSLSRDHRNHYFWWACQRSRHVARYDSAFCLFHACLPNPTWNAIFDRVNGREKLAIRTIPRRLSFQQFWRVLRSFVCRFTRIFGGQIRREMPYLSNSWELWEFWRIDYSLWRMYTDFEVWYFCL